VPLLDVDPDDTERLDNAKIFGAPDDPADWPAWRETLARWRAEAVERVGYDGSSYELPEFAWARRCFSVALAWLWDETLYDHEAGRFTPERFLDEGREQFGGYDGVVLWHAYPVIGIDERNQFDFYRDVPGIRELVAALHERAPDTLEVPFAATWREAVDDAARRRVVLDQVASLTDGSAVAWHRRLVG
jgi:hypothetical protein